MFDEVFDAFLNRNPDREFESDPELLLDKEDFPSLANKASNLVDWRSGGPELFPFSLPE